MRLTKLQGTRLNNKIVQFQRIILFQRDNVTRETVSNTNNNHTAKFGSKNFNIYQLGFHMIFINSHR